MIDNKKVSSYLLYAVGEVFLVVLGILIAVSLNNWNEQKKLALQETELKRAIYEELLVNQQIAINTRKRIEFSMQFIDSMVYHWDHLDMDLVKSFPVNKYGYNLFGLIGYTISFHQFLTLPEDVYRTAVNDGSIAVIRDREFVRYVELVYERARRINDFMEDEDEVSRNIHDYVSLKYGSLFLGKEVVSDSLSESFNNGFLSAIAADGTLRYKFIERSRLKKARVRLTNILKEEIDVALESYE